MNRRNPSETKQLLFRTFLNTLNIKPFQKISVNELCEKSVISRSTFYLHFKDKYELLSAFLNEIYKELNSAMEYYSPRDFLMEMLNICQENEKLFYNIFGYELNEEMLEIFYQFFSKYFTQFLEEKNANGVLLPGPIDSVAAFYVGGLTSMTLRWIKSNYKIPKETLVSCQYRLLKDLL